MNTKILFSVLLFFLMVFPQSGAVAFPTEFTFSPTLEAKIEAKHGVTIRIYSSPEVFFDSLQGDRGDKKLKTGESIPVKITKTKRILMRYGLGQQYYLNCFYYTLFKNGDEGWVNVSYGYNFEFNKPIGTSLFETSAKDRQYSAGFNKKANLRTVSEIKQIAKKYKGKMDKFWDGITIPFWSSLLDEITILTPYTRALKYAIEQENIYKSPKASEILSILKEKDLIIAHYNFISSENMYYDRSQRHALLNINGKIVHSSDEVIDSMGKLTGSNISGKDIRFVDIYYFPLNSIPQKGIARFIVIDKGSGKEMSNYMFNLQYLK